MKIEKEVLERMYLVEVKSQLEIAKELRCGRSTIQRLMTCYGIQQRAFSTKGLQPCLGRVLSDETKQRIGDSRRGKKLSPEHREKVIKTLRPGEGMEKHSRWKGGITKCGGYVLIKRPDHPFANANGYIKRSHLVAEGIIGRHIQPGEIVHHMNRIKDDDSPENLLILTASEHTTLHNREG